MLSKSSVLAVIFAFKLNIVFKTCPYIWDKESACLSISKRISTTNLFYSTLSFALFRLVFILFRCATTNPEKIGSNYFVAILLLSQSVLAAGLQWNSAVKQREGCCVINWLLHLDSSLTGNGKYK
jgi:hypothetical protein